MSNTNNQKSTELRARLARQQKQRQQEEEECQLADERLCARAEAEQELLRQIVAEEERECQDAEELEVLRRAEAEWAEDVRRMQSPLGGVGATVASPMRVDNWSEGKEEKEKEKKKRVLPGK